MHHGPGPVSEDDAEAPRAGGPLPGGGDAVEAAAATSPFSASL